jgi:hypothetical protein
VEKYGITFSTSHQALKIFRWGDAESLDYIESTFGLFTHIDLMKLWDILDVLGLHYLKEEMMWKADVLIRLIRWEPLLTQRVINRFQDFFNDAVNTLHAVLCTEFDSIFEFLSFGFAKLGTEGAMINYDSTRFFVQWKLKSFIKIPFEVS